MKTVEIFFYLDFSDASSYLAAVGLRRLTEEVPVQVTLVPVDTTTLTARAGEPGVKREALGKAYRQKDIERFARQLGVPIRWPEGSLLSGLALRVLARVSEQSPQLSLPLALAIFETIWSRNGTLSEQSLRECLEAVGISSDNIIEKANEPDAFQILDVALSAALVNGVFDIPTIRVGSELFVGFDRVEFVRRAALTELLRARGQERLIAAVVDLLLQLEPSRRSHFVEKLEDSDGADAGEGRPTGRDARFDAVTSNVRTWSINPRPRLPIAAPAGPIKLRVSRTLSSEAHGGEELLLRLLTGCPPEHGVLHGPAPMVINDLSRLRHSLIRAPKGASGLVGVAHTGGRRTVIYVSPSSEESPGHIRTQMADIQPDGEVLSHVLSSGRVAYLDGPLAFDPNVHRKAALGGAHVLVLNGAPAKLVSAAASAIRCARWVVCLSDTLEVYDGNGDRRTFLEDSVNLSLPWPPVHDAEATPWSAPHPRTLLVSVEPLTIGPLDTGSELAMAVRGQGLLLSTAGLKSILGTNRRYEIVRVESGPLVIIPLFSEHVLASEVSTYRLLNALSRCPLDAHVLFVNFWPELSYEELRRLRPVLAATAEELNSPVLVVVGARPIELWQPDVAKGPAYRIEPEGDEFCLDFSLQPNARERQARFVEPLEPNPERYTQLLQSFSGRD